jgi:hypothetical protein
MLSQQDCVAYWLGGSAGLTRRRVDADQVSTDDGPVRRLVISLVVAGLLLAPSPASALYLIEDGTRSKTSYFEARDCQATASVSLAAPGGANNVAPESLQVGETVTAYDSYYQLQSSAAITAVEVQRRAGRPVATWTATPDPAICEDDPLTDIGWYSADRRFVLTYRLRQQVRMSRRDAADLAEEAVVRRFPYYPNSSGSSTRCRGPTTRARCEVGFWAGDTSFAGVVRVALSASPDHRRLLWSYRMRIVQTNEYCLFVTHDYPCRKTYRKSRQRLPAPSWLH